MVTIYAVATCVCSILRGTSTNEFNDAVDNSTVAASGVITSIEETTSRVLDPTSQTPRVIRSVNGRVTSNVDIRVTDRLRDDTHATVYIVENVTQPGGPGFTSDLELELRRVT